MRGLRFKLPKARYHIICRGISDITLFQDDHDKEVFLNNVRKVKKIFNIKIHAYCVMSTHVHLIVDTDNGTTTGADISKVMQSLCLRYSIYYNKSNNRHGPVFSDRFKSIIINNDKYFLVVSAYIHMNPKDIRGYLNQEENYNFSSFGIYISKFKDKYDLVCTDSILKHFGSNKLEAIKSYYNFVAKRRNSNIKDELAYLKSENIKLADLDFELENLNTEYKSNKSVLIKNCSADNVVDFASSYTKISKSEIHLKYNHNSLILRAVSILLMRGICDFEYKKICDCIGNITPAAASSLCNKGYDIINHKYKNIINDFLKKYNVM